jgi:hypothetical protein
MKASRIVFDEGLLVSFYQFPQRSESWLMILFRGPSGSTSRTNGYEVGS